MYAKGQEFQSNSAQSMWEMYYLRDVLVYIPRMTQEQTRRRTRALKESVRAGYLVTDTAQCSPERGRECTGLVVSFII